MQPLFGSVHLKPGGPSGGSIFVYSENQDKNFGFASDTAYYDGKEFGKHPTLESSSDVFSLTQQANEFPGEKGFAKLSKENGAVLKRIIGLMPEEMGYTAGVKASFEKSLLSDKQVAIQKINGGFQLCDKNRVEEPPSAPTLAPEPTRAQKQRFSLSHLIDTAKRLRNLRIRIVVENRNS